MKRRRSERGPRSSNSGSPSIAMGDHRTVPPARETMSTIDGFNDKVGFIWSVADLLRGDIRQHEYGQFILPFVVLRRLDCVLDPTKNKVIERAHSLEGRIGNVDPILQRVSGAPFYNT